MIVAQFKKLYDVLSGWVEPFTSGMRVISTDHALIHQKLGYSISNVFTNVANGATVNYAFKTPTVASGKYIHLKYKDIQSSSSKITVALYEAPTNAPTGGVAATPINRNRVGNPPATSMQAVNTAMTINTAGAVQLDVEQFIGGQAKSLDIEYVLKPDTWYIRTFTNGTGGAVDISAFEFWYEEN